MQRAAEPGSGVVAASPGVSIAPFGDGAIVFDAVAEKAHRIEGFAAYVLDTVMGCGAIGYDGGCVATLTDLGLLGRTVAPAEPPGTLTPTITTPDPAWSTGRTHAYLDHRLVFCGPDPGLLSEIDAHLGDRTATIDGSPTVHFGVVPRPGGRIDYFDTSHWDFTDRDQLLWQLPGALNVFMARSESLVVLHAGAVRTPDGAVVAVTGPVDAGKSTLIGALVRAGCDYVGDESTGIHPDTLHAWGYPKPLTLDPTSQHLVGLDHTDAVPSPVMHRRAAEIRPGTVCVGGDAGAVDLVVEVSYRAGATYSAAPLEAGDAIRVLMTNTLNLVRVGTPGLEALARMAESVPVVHVSHGDSLEVAHRIADAGADTGRLV